MSLIQRIVHESLTAGYLSIESEKLLRQLLQTTQYGLEEVWAFTHLQRAAMSGQVKQQSREQLQATAS